MSCKIVKLPNGKGLYNSYGYKLPNLSIILPSNYEKFLLNPIPWKLVKNSRCVFKNRKIQPDTYFSIQVIHGHLYKSKSNRNCFVLNKNGDDHLYCIRIGKTQNIRAMIGYLKNHSKYIKIWSFNGNKLYSKLIYVVM